jgi:tRNA threonylcarbamoyladenosine biosynthesis protein TsaE
MSTDPCSIYLSDEAATVSAGRTLGHLLEGRGLITLQGNLGCGKTTLSRGLIQSLGHTGAVKSPTYTLVEPYEIGSLQIFHYDLYRLSDPEELEFLGMRDFLDAETLTLVEWPERAGKLLPPADLALTLQVEGNGRRLSWQSHTTRGQQLSHALLEALRAATQS